MLVQRSTEWDLAWATDTDTTATATFTATNLTPLRHISKFQGIAYNSGPLLKRHEPEIVECWTSKNIFMPFIKRASFSSQKMLLGSFQNIKWIFKENPWTKIIYRWTGGKSIFTFQVKCWTWELWCTKIFHLIYIISGLSSFILLLAGWGVSGGTRRHHISPDQIHFFSRVVFFRHFNSNPGGLVLGAQTLPLC